MYWYIYKYTCYRLLFDFSSFSLPGEDASSSPGIQYNFQFERDDGNWEEREWMVFVPTVGKMLQQDQLLGEWEKWGARMLLPWGPFFGCLNSSLHQHDFFLTLPWNRETTNVQIATDPVVPQCWILADILHKVNEARRKQASCLPRRRCEGVIAAEVTVTSRRKVRTHKGAETVWKQVPGRSFARGPLLALLSAKSFGLSPPSFLRLMAEMLGVQESNDFPVIILSLEKLFLLMRALCLWFTSLYRKASTQTAIQKTTLVSFSKCWSESMWWCQETGPFIPCWEGNFTFFFLFLPLPRWKGLYCISGPTQNCGGVAVFYQWTASEQYSLESWTIILKYRMLNQSITT